ncbi:sugar ABC transporter substrate-binding protein [Embleya hyalina]|uniref:Ribose ABC transporter substrate-binding protein n=1 Tax=Embleya hyalina TaxID=516124 RepID=A0A401Z5W3_9ACTN|nr:sugar ABC transporter substrate-binding protein [Embleya hyalina]GCE02219.1 ribose ABC transporter substrate-binding protein [Embleya hyalina]
MTHMTHAARTTRRARLAPIALVTAGLLAASACGDGGGSSSTSSGHRKVKTITYVNPLPSYPDFNIAGKCFEAEARKQGWKPVQVGISGTAVDNQGSINQITQALASGTDALVVVPVVDKLFTPVIKQARGKGVYVVGLNAGDANTGQQTQVGTVHRRMGAVMADGLGAKYPDARVAFLSVSAGTVSHADQIAGFKAQAAAKYPGMKFVANEYDNGDATKDVDIIGNMLTAHPDITAIFTPAGAALPAAITAVREHGMSDKVAIVGLDLTDDHRKAVEQGQIHGLGIQGWCEMGTRSVQAVRDLEQGKAIPPNIDTGATFVTKETLPAQ